MTKKSHNPAALASEYMALGMEGTVCEHGVDRFTGQLVEPEISPRNGRKVSRGRLAIKTTEWVCKCCTWVENGPMPEDQLCHYCDGTFVRMQDRIPPDPT